MVLLLGILLYLLAVALHYLLAASREAKEREEREAELKSLARDAELQALKERLNPHFLFNALNSIGSLAAARPEEARRMCALLSDFLRTTLGLSGKAEIPLSEEIALARRYLAVERVRFGDRLGVAEDLDPAASDTLVPPLLLQPLVENAVKHGIAGRLDGGTLTLVTKRFGDRVSIVVENPAGADAPRAAGTGLGLANVARRVAASWGDSGHFSARRLELHVPRRDRAARARVSGGRRAPPQPASARLRQRGEKVPRDVGGRRCSPATCWFRRRIPAAVSVPDSSSSAARARGSRANASERTTKAAS